MTRWTLAEPGRVVRDGIGGADSEHGWGELRRTGLHEHARITMVPTMTRWPPVDPSQRNFILMEIFVLLALKVLRLYRKSIYVREGLF